MMLAQLHDETRTLVSDLSAVWTQLGLRPAREQERIDAIMVLVREVITYCSVTEKETMEKMIKYRDYRRHQIDDMLSALHLPPFETQGNLPLLDEAKMLKIKFEELKQVKEERMEQLSSLLAKRDSLCDILDEKAKELKLETNIPSEVEIMNLQTYVSDLNVIRNKRFNQFMTVKKAVVALAVELEMKAKTDLEKKVLDEPEKEFILSEKNLKKVVDLHQSLKAKIDENTQKKNKIVERLEYLWKQLDMSDDGVRILNKYPGISDRIIDELSFKELSKYEALRKERMADFIDKVKLEVESWWETCCFDEERIEAFKNIVADMEPESEDVLNKWEEQLTLLKEYHADHKKEFDALEAWRCCWEEFETIENNEKDPDRYKNRRIPSTQIMKEQQQKKQLERKIAKLEEQLITTSRELVEQGKPFCIYTSLLSDYVEGKRMEHDEVKENEKAMKKNAKNQKTIMEAKGMVRAQYRGGNVVPRAQPTPTKRSAAASSSRDELSPSKTRRVVNCKQTTPMAPPVLTRQNTITKSSSSLKRPVVGSSLATRGRTASQMSIISVNEEEFQVSMNHAPPFSAD